MRMKLFVGLVAAALIGICVALAAQTAPPKVSEQEVLRLMRQVMSVEMNKPYGKGAFTDLLHVLAAGPTGLEIVQLDANTGQLDGYLLRVAASADHNHFQASVTPREGCGTAWFGDERSVIYTGKKLGCK